MDEGVAAWAYDPNEDKLCFFSPDGQGGKWLGGAGWGRLPRIFRPACFHPASPADPSFSTTKGIEWQFFSFNSSSGSSF